MFSHDSAIADRVLINSVYNPKNMEQSDAWESFYHSNNRPWRGMTDITVPFTEGSHILEVGCGNGKTSVALKSSGMKVTGVDFSQSAIEMCRRIDSESEYVCASATKLPFDDETFDGAVMFHVLEHLNGDERIKAVCEIVRVLRKGSHILIKVFSSEDMRSDKGERIDSSTVIRGNGIMYHYFTENELRQLFDRMTCPSIRTVEERTRFGEIRSRIEAEFIIE